MNDTPLEQDEANAVAILGVFSSDVEQSAELGKHCDTQFTRRTYIRAVFALIEGNINVMSDVVLKAALRGEIILSEGDMESLKQERQHNGKTRPSYHKLCDRLGEVCAAFARLNGSDFVLNKNSRGWTDFLEAIQVRNDIMHPKSTESFHVSDTRFGQVQRARSWHNDELARLLQTCLREPGT